jgi:hypothetical protein
MIFTIKEPHFFIVFLLQSVDYQVQFRTPWEWSSSGATFEYGNLRSILSKSEATPLLAVVALGSLGVLSVASIKGGVTYASELLLRLYTLVSG